IEYRAPEYFFVKKDFHVAEQYAQGFSVKLLFPVNSSGIKTHRDNFVIGLDKDKLSRRLEEFFNLELLDDEVRIKYTLKDNRDWNLSESRQENKFDRSKLLVITYRPFDIRPIYYDSTVIDFDRMNVMRHLLQGNNLALVCPKQVPDKEVAGAIISNTITAHKSFCAYNTNSIFPLYLYPKEDNQQTLGESNERTPNLNAEMVEVIAKSLGLAFVAEKVNDAATFAPIDLLDYIYAVLHSPSYRDKYKEFLKIDFPRIPYPKDTNKFWQLVKLGGELRGIHLLESPAVEKYITSYPKDGDNFVSRKATKKDWQLYDAENGLGRVWINDKQYFDKIPLIAWEFYIGGYQPAQKWLKDRFNRTLNFDDILHYQKIIVALSETDRLMQCIDASCPLLAGTV
ncbi:MAG: type ISP restriction/modification enzyme, partial [Mariprofundales bacterium]